MKKVRNIIVAICALAAAAVLWVLAGSNIVRLKSGPVPLGPEEEFSQAEGKFITYEAAYPVAFCPEEYYSGDPDRVRTYGYVVYDEGRDTFLYMVLPENSDGQSVNLMNSLSLAAELRAAKDMTPDPVSGSLDRMEEADVARVIQVLEESEIMELYNDCKDEPAYYEAYFSDEYGEIMAAMCQKISAGINQPEWYRIESATINGIATPDILICALAAGMSLLIAIGSVISLFTGDKAAGKGAESGSTMERFLAEQRVWVAEWCQYCRARSSRSAYLSVLIWVVVLGTIGYFAKTPVQRILTFHVALGLLLGELTAVLIVLIQKGQSKPGKILKRMEKNLRKAFPAPGALEEFAEDFLKAGEEWAFQERKKDSMLYGRLGSRYWSAFSGMGLPTIVEVGKLARVVPETISGAVRSGKVRVSYESHIAKFYYEGTPAWENGDKTFSFQTVGSRDSFLALAAKKGVEGVEVRER